MPLDTGAPVPVEGYFWRCGCTIFYAPYRGAGRETHLSPPPPKGVQRATHSGVGCGRVSERLEKAGTVRGSGLDTEGLLEGVQSILGSDDGPQP